MCNRSATVTGVEQSVTALLLRLDKPSFPKRKTVSAKCPNFIQIGQ